MTFNVLGWISYNEGDAIPDAGALVEFVVRDGDCEILPSEYLSWEILNDGRDIVAYRVINDE